MKKSLLIIAAVAMSFVACSKEEIQNVGKGMTLSANVADDNTKATIDKNSGTGKWNFSWETNDVVSVKSPSGLLYDFTYDGTSFKCETALPEAGTWSVAYAANSTVDNRYFISQDGTLESAMKKYWLTGSCHSDGSSTLSCKMDPKFAVLAVTLTVTQYIQILDGNLKSGYLSGLDSDGTIMWSKSEVSFPKKTSIEAVTQYFVVPVDVPLIVSNDKGKTSSARTLKKGKVYTLSM